MADQPPSSASDAPEPNGPGNIGPRPSADARRVAARLEQLREQRGMRERARDLSRDLAFTQQRLRTLSRSIGSLGAAWEQCCPPDLVERTALVAFARGRLTVTVPDAATRHTADRWLRTGGLEALRASGGVSLREVKLVFGRLPSEDRRG